MIVRTGNRSFYRLRSERPLAAELAGLGMVTVPTVPRETTLDRVLAAFRELNTTMEVRP